MPISRIIERKLEAALEKLANPDVVGGVSEVKEAIKEAIKADVAEQIVRRAKRELGRFDAQSQRDREQQHVQQQAALQAEAAPAKRLQAALYTKPLDLAELQGEDDSRETFTHILFFITSMGITVVLMNLLIGILSANCWVAALALQGLLKGFTLNNFDRQGLLKGF